VLLNHRRKTTVGLSFDYQLCNLLGFACYAIYTSAYYWSTAIQEEYKRRHGGAANKIEPNDVAFALHAVAITCVTIGQVLYYDGRGGRWWQFLSTAGPPRQRPSALAVTAVASTTGDDHMSMASYLFPVHRPLFTFLDSSGAAAVFGMGDWARNCVPT
jgi:PQ loop repeat